MLPTQSNKGKFFFGRVQQSPKPKAKGTKISPLQKASMLQHVDSVSRTWLLMRYLSRGSS